MESNTRSVYFHIWSKNHRKHYVQVRNMLTKMKLAVGSNYLSVKDAKHQYGGDHSIGEIEIKDQTTKLPWDKIEDLAIKLDINIDAYDDDFKG